MTERFNEMALTLVSSSDFRMFSPYRGYRTEIQFSFKEILNIFQYAKPQINIILFTVREPVVGQGL